MGFVYSEKGGKTDVNYEGGNVQFHESVIYGKSCECINSSVTLFLVERPEQGTRVYIPC